MECTRRKTRSTSCSGGEEKEENAFGGLGSSLGVTLAASTPKAEPRPKAADFEEVIQGVE
ncbi:hypothetical protein [Brevibacillus panacihumi]|uniref:Uncharacterized protein n=1 Tax=Brevibacillus panacihumi TaxID=497735 RepID=A0A3M8CXV1_9BACL|nr:hypothetical protein [Brevibacillus panacihumi]RNB80077.1 hypothetical protein EDM58_09295 [Brevibacillus panacihumi]